MKTDAGEEPWIGINSQIAFSLSIRRSGPEVYILSRAEAEPYLPVVQVRLDLGLGVEVIPFPLVLVIKIARRQFKLAGQRRCHAANWLR